MDLKQVFSTYSEGEEVDFGQFKYCPFCGSLLVLKEKGGKERPACCNGELSGIYKRSAKISHGKE